MCGQRPTRYEQGPKGLLAMGLRFQKTVEDFTCAVCGAQVAGNGFTNHCPRCLWSRHVDRFPGDRASACQGMMRPVAVESRGRRLMVRHRCERCGAEVVNRLGKEDDFQAALDIMRRRPMEVGGR